MLRVGARTAYGHRMGDVDADWLRQLPVRRVERSPYAALRPDAWPLTIPAVAQVMRDGLDLGTATVLVGDNGTGKSTLVEAIAMAYGLNAEGGSTGARHRTHDTESGLWDDLRLVRGAGSSKWGYFVRAETMHGLLMYLDTTRRESPGSRDPEFHVRSHGESFVTLLSTGRFAGDGLFVWDEPEAGLSFPAQLHLVAELAQMMARPRTQVLLATHSPILAALPGATVLELSESGIAPVEWRDLEVVDHYRRFLEAPERYLRHVID
ncbi:putative ATPase [Knoellia remsis]|uniref:Putative ATPase n=2 Tax=Knoellia remsis TaxID=407159 RepID=A0A2T0ULI8_9MICO|nr:putative ATPase [Knoellia remsis]